MEAALIEKCWRQYDTGMYSTNSLTQPGQIDKIIKAILFLMFFTTSNPNMFPIQRILNLDSIDSLFNIARTSNFDSDHVSYYKPYKEYCISIIQKVNIYKMVDLKYMLNS